MLHLHSQQLRRLRRGSVESQEAPSLKSIGSGQSACEKQSNRKQSFEIDCKPLAANGHARRVVLASSFTDVETPDCEDALMPGSDAMRAQSMGLTRSSQPQTLAGLLQDSHL